jgi:hypothetical protein
MKASNPTHPMKTLPLIFVLLVAVALLPSCFKDSLSKPKGGTTTTTSTKDTSTTNQPVVPIDPNMLVGTWQVINDTSTTVPWGIWEGRPTTGTNYVGTSADYYKFTANGNAYTRLNNVIDTANYTVSQDTVHMIYTYFNGQEQTGGVYNSFWTVTNLSAHTATVTVQFVSPETATTSVVYLRK